MASEKLDSNKALFYASLALLIAGLLSGLGLLPRVFRPSSHASMGQPAPDIALNFVLNPLDGPAPARLANLRGKAVLLDFWATWCGPCKAEAPILDRVAKRYSDRGLVVIGVNTSDEDGNAASWASSHGLSYPIAFDEGNASARKFGVTNLPTLVLVDRSGNIKAFRSGLTPMSELERLVDDAL